MTSASPEQLLRTLEQDPAGGDELVATLWPIATMVGGNAVGAVSRLPVRGAIFRSCYRNSVSETVLRWRERALVQRLPRLRRECGAVCAE